MTKGRKTFIGYDPGGNGAHGLAVLTVDAHRVVDFSHATVDTAQQAIEAFKACRVAPTVLGIDTLTCWSTGPSGWRPADRWLRARYPDVVHSVVAANSMFGAMAINGGAVIQSLRSHWPKLGITEVHPKVLYRAMSGTKYDAEHRGQAMCEWLGSQLGCEVMVSNDHVWDALLCAFAAWQGFTGKWKRNLHKEPLVDGETLVHPFGPSRFWWPED